MAPTIIRLELARIERLLIDSEIGSDFYNALVRVRYALRRFVEHVESAHNELDETPEESLRTALLVLSPAAGLAGESDAETLKYVAHRLRYVHERIQLIY